MPRISGAGRETVEPSIEKAFQGQEKKWGAVLAPYPLYARRPTIFSAVQGMWMGLARSGLLDRGLVSLLNRRVASLNGCVFWQDINAAVGSELGVPEEKILALADYATSPLFNEAERVALEYADSMTITGREVPDELFARLRRFYDEDAVVELTATIAWENSSSKFNRALRVPSQEFWRGRLSRPR